MTRGNLEEQLRAAAAALPPQPVTLAALAQAQGGTAVGGLLLLMAVPSLLPLPGAGTVLGLGLAALAWALWRGRAADALPPRVAALQMSPAWARRVLLTLASLYGLAARLARSRLCHLAGPATHGPVAAAVGAMAVVMVLPIPFGNVLPALAVSLIAVGLVFRDGLAVAVGLGTSALTVAGLAALSVMLADWGLGLVA